MFSIKVTGLNKMNGKLVGLSKNTRTQLNKDVEGFMRDVRKSAKLRAPRDTGKLASSIKITKDGNNYILTVDSSYGVFQEEGFKPHWVYIKQSNKIKPGFHFVSKNKPFIRPALESNLNKLPDKLRKTINRLTR